MIIYTLYENKMNKKIGFFGNFLQKKEVFKYFRLIIVIFIGKERHIVKIFAIKAKRGIILREY